MITTGDSDADADVDLADFAALVGVWRGPAAPPVSVPPECVGLYLAAFDGDGDGDLDLADFAVFQRVFAAPP